MSTQSYIGILNGNTVDAIYCHYDGQLNYTGQLLKEYYNDTDTVTKLVELGSISVLGTTIGKKVDFDTYNSAPEMMKRYNNGEEMQTVAYHRDRGEPLEIFKGSIDEYRNLKNEYDFIYLFDNGWKYCTYDMNDFEKF